MASISSLGVGSGLDLSSIVNGLVDAERAPTENRLNLRESDITTELSAFGALKSSLSLFQGTLSNVQAPSTYNTKQSSLSDQSVFSATVGSTADTGSYRVEVTDLAQNHSLASNAATTFSSVNDVVGSGTLTIRFGTTTDPYGFTQDASKSTEVITVSAANGNNTLSGLRDYINDNDFGIRASVINDGNGFRLTLTSENSGAANSMEITASGDGDGNDTDNSGLSQLAFNASAQTSMLQTVVAQDAALNINGLAISRETNTVSGAIDGVTLNLLKKDVGNVVTLNISEDTSSITSAIEEFVDGYNGLSETINALTRFDPATEQAGLLIGDPTVRNISTRLRSLVSSAVPQLSGSVRSLADIGITTQGNGQLQLDSAALVDAVSSFPSEVEALFRAQGRPTDSDVLYTNSTADTQAGNYGVFINALATQGVYNGTTVNNLTIDANNDVFVVAVDGTTSNTIQLSQAVYASGEALAAHIQAQINDDDALKAVGRSVSVSYDGVNNEFDLTSARYGSVSKVEFISLDTNSVNDLGFNLGASGAAGTDISGSINGLSASGSGQTLTSSAGDSQGLALLINAGSTGNRGSVSFSRGMISDIHSLLDSYLDSDGLINAKENGLNEALEEISEQREQLDIRIQSLEARLIAQFSALDSLISQFNTTSSFLTQQLANLPEPNSVGNN